MPDELNWTVAMVLKWVLTRDQKVVLAMIDTYDVWIFEDGTRSRLIPEDVRAVTKAYCIDETIENHEEKVRTAVARIQRVIAAKDEIYRALRQSDLEVRARRNGTGDIETIAPNQWLGLKFKSWMGHDLAAPVNIEQDFLPLPHATERYLAGEVPADVLPAVWPDPLFVANQVFRIWPPCDSRRADVEPGNPPSQPTGATQEKETSTSTLSVASLFDIKRALEDAASQLKAEGLSSSEERLWPKVKAALPDKQVPRGRFREARGPRPKGRPKKSPD
jgi:hypothetical protein